MRSSRDDQRYWRINPCDVVAVDTAPNTSVPVPVSVRLCRLPEAAAGECAYKKKKKTKKKKKMMMIMMKMKTA